MPTSSSSSMTMAVETEDAAARVTQTRHARVKATLHLPSRAGERRSARRPRRGGARAVRATDPRKGLRERAISPRAAARQERLLRRAAAEGRAAAAAARSASLGRGSRCTRNEGADLGRTCSRRSNCSRQQQQPRFRSSRASLGAPRSSAVGLRLAPRRLRRRPRPTAREAAGRQLPPPPRRSGRSRLILTRRRRRLCRVGARPRRHRPHGMQRKA